MANAQRLVDDLGGADWGFAEAREAWRAAGEDRRVEAELCDLEASLRIYQRRHGEALELLAIMGPQEGLLTTEEGVLGSPGPLPQ